MRPIFDQSRIAGRPGPFDYDGRNGARNEGKDDDANARRRSSIVRAQCAADPVKIAREIVRANIEAGLKVTVMDAAARRQAAEQWKAKLDGARSVAEIMIVESHAAAAYWRTFRDAGLRRAEGGQSSTIMAALC